MVITEYDEKEHLRRLARDLREEERKQYKEKDHERIRRFSAKDIPPEDIAECMGYDIETVIQILQDEARKAPTE